MLEGLGEVITDDAELHQIGAARGEKYVDPRRSARDTILVVGTPWPGSTAPWPAVPTGGSTPSRTTYTVTQRFTVCMRSEHASS